jgi:hypothetical protein
MVADRRPRSRAAPPLISTGCLCFVLANSFVSAVRFRLLMILLPNESRIERPMQIAISFDLPSVPAVTVLQETPDSDTRYGFICSYLLCLFKNPL